MKTISCPSCGGNTAEWGKFVPGETHQSGMPGTWPVETPPGVKCLKCGHFWLLER